MKIYKLIGIVLILISCNQNSKIQYEKNTEVFSLEALQGVWAENDNENALFFIAGDSLFYIDNQSFPVLIELSRDTLTIKGNVIVKCKILKLTKDSLWFEDEYNNQSTKLYKRIN